MADIIFNVAAKIFLNFTPITLALIREKDNIKPTSLLYSNGTGQIMTTGQALYVTGNAGQPGYLELRVNTTTTLNGTGSVPVTVYSHPTSTQANQTVPILFDESTITLNLTYNSIPTNQDIFLDLDNRAIYNFTIADFTNKFNDVDGDTLAEIMTSGTVNNYEYDTTGTGTYTPYVSGTWIPVSFIPRLRFKSPDQNQAHNQTNPWFAKDSQGNISE